MTPSLDLGLAAIREFEAAAGPLTLAMLSTANGFSLEGIMDLSRLTQFFESSTRVRSLFKQEEIPNFNKLLEEMIKTFSDPMKLDPNNLPTFGISDAARELYGIVLKYQPFLSCLHHQGVEL